MKNILILLLVFLLPSISFADPVQPWQYNKAVTTANSNLTECSNAMSYLMSNLADTTLDPTGDRVASGKSANMRHLAAEYCKLAADELQAIITGLIANSFDVQGEMTEPAQ